MEKKKIKFTYGHGVIIALVLFMIMITYLVVYYGYVQADNYDMVTENYYEKELKYQQVIDARNNVYNLAEKPQIKVFNGKGIQIIFPKEFNAQNTKGEIYFYRPSNDDLDKKFPLNISTNQDIYITKELLQVKNKEIEGLYVAKITWHSNHKNYYWEEKINWK